MSSSNTAFNVTRGIILISGTISFFIVYYIMNGMIDQEFDIPFVHAMLDIPIGLMYFIFFYGLMIKFSPKNIIIGFSTICILIIFYIFVLLETKMTDGC
jgi:hypothetical protein